MDVKKTLDCIGLFCPMPIANTKLELDTMQSNEVLEVLADDPGIKKDLPAWCATTGNEFLELKEEDGVFKGYVRKK